MTDDRVHPFDLVFGDLAPERFPAIADDVPGRPDLDAFLMAGPVVELLRDLRPEEGLGDAMDDFVAFVHAAYCFWAAGRHTRTLDAQATRDLCTAASHPDPAITLDPAVVEYIQVAPRMVWSRLADADVHEPLDGWFALPGERTLRVVACLGVHPARPGLSVLATEGIPPASLDRGDGSPAFAPRMEGGDTAGLASVATPEELLALAWSAAVRGEGT